MRRADILWFVNCEVRGWVTEKPCLKWAPRPWQGSGGTVRVAFGCVVNLTAEPLTFVLSPSEGERRRFARLIGAQALGGFRILLKWLFG